MEMLGEDRYQTKRSLDIYEKAASNHEGTGAFVSGGATAKGLDQPNNLVIGNSHVKICPSCNGTISSKAKFCNLCGGKIEAKIVCPSCDYENEENSKFCSSCGVNLVKLICECGNELHQIDRFCNNCGKKANTFATE